MKSLLSVVSLASLIAASDHSSRATPVNDGIHLAIHPSCGNLSGAPADVSAGLFPLEHYTTIVAFGDSYTSCVTNDGGVRPPPVLIPPSSKAGGRITNGPVWVENLGTDIGAVVKDYAVSGSVTNSSLWPGRTRDLIGQVTKFLGQSNQLDPNRTLYSIFIGINDFQAALGPSGLANLRPASLVIMNQIERLAMPPTNARNFLVVDDTELPVDDKRTPEGDAFVQRYFSGLNQLHTTGKIPGFRVGFVDLQHIWEGVLTTPGLAAFGYTSFGPCVTGDTTDGMCSDPAHTFTWFPRHPSKQTHRIMADYVKEVLSQCRI